MAFQIGWFAGLGKHVMMRKCWAKALRFWLCLAICVVLPPEAHTANLADSDLPKLGLIAWCHPFFRASSEVIWGYAEQPAPVGDLLSSYHIAFEIENNDARTFKMPLISSYFLTKSGMLQIISMDELDEIKPGQKFIYHVDTGQGYFEQSKPSELFVTLAGAAYRSGLPDIFECHKSEKTPIQLQKARVLPNVAGVLPLNLAKGEWRRISMVPTPVIRKERPQFSVYLYYPDVRGFIDADREQLPAQTLGSLFKIIGIEDGNSKIHQMRETSP